MLKVFPLFLLILMTSWSQVSAQNFSWNLISKVEDNFNTHYLGTSSGNHFLLTSKFTIKNDNFENSIAGIQFARKNVIQIVKYDAQFNIQLTKPIELKQQIFELKSGFVSGPKIILVYYGIFGKNSLGTFMDVFDLQGNLLEAKTLGETLYPIYSFPKQEMFFIQNKASIFYNGALKEIAKFPVDLKVLNMISNDDGSAFYALLNKEAEYSIAKFDIKNNKVSKEIINISKENIKDYQLKIYGDQLYLSSVFGAKDKFYFYSKGVLIQKINLNSLKEEKAYLFEFTPETLASVSGKKNLEKLQGLKSVSLRDFHLADDGSIISVLENNYTEKITVDGSSTFSAMYEKIILAKTDTEGKTIQKLIDRDAKSGSVYEYLFSLSSFYKNNHLYLLFNDAHGPFKLRTYKLNANLEVVENKEMNTYKEKELYLGVRNFYQLDSNKYIAWGRWQKKLGSVFVSF